MKPLNCIDYIEANYNRNLQETRKDLFKAIRKIKDLEQQIANLKKNKEQP